MLGETHVKAQNAHGTTSSVSRAAINRSFDTRLTRVEDSVEDLKKDFSDSRKENKEQFINLNSALERIDTNNAVWREQQLKSKQTNWFGLITIIVIILGAIGSAGMAGMTILWMIIGMQEKSDIGPIKESIARITVDQDNTKRDNTDITRQLLLITAQNATSIQERQDLRRDVNSNKDATDKCHLEVMGIVKDLQEVESQFKKIEDEANLQHAHQERKINEFQSELHDLGAKVPEPKTDPFYFPQIPDIKR